MANGYSSGDAFVVNGDLDVLGNIKHGGSQITAEANITTADATDLATVIALANATKAKVNSLLTKLRAAGIISV